MAKRWAVYLVVGLLAACSTASSRVPAGAADSGSVGPEVCDDGADNDGDKRVDCIDSDCDGVDECESVERSCDDGADNDGDAVTDCADPSCDGVGTCEFGQEHNCFDGNDNDGDDLADCMDPSCSGIGSCEHTAELSCGDGHDNDIDGMSDCDDSDCSGSGACLLTSCPAGTNLVNVGGSGLPLSIPDMASATSELVVTQTGKVKRIAVEVSIQHTFSQDLALTLVGPGDQRFMLSSDHGSGANSYADTIFSDLGVLPIADAAAPFSAVFQPEQSLAPLLGKSPAGTWALEVADTAAADVGSLTEFAVVMCVCPSPCPF